MGAYKARDALNIARFIRFCAKFGGKNALIFTSLHKTVSYIITIEDFGHLQGLTGRFFLMGSFTIFFIFGQDSYFG